jgi:hypothetical protein
VNKTMSGVMVAGAVALAVGNFGCHHDRPETYEDQRPPTDALVGGNTGIQAKDVGAATDRFARDLLGQPALNGSPTQYTVVLTSVENHTTDPTMSYEAFDSRLKGLIGQLGQGRVALIENKAKFHQLQNQELEGPPPDPTGQGNGGMPAGVQPNFDLYLTIDEMPNRATSYFLITGKLVNLKTRVIEWTSPNYEFQSAR